MTQVSCTSRLTAVLKLDSCVGHCPHKPWHQETTTCRTKGQKRAGVQLKWVQHQPFSGSPSLLSSCYSTNPTFSLFCYAPVIFKLGKQMNTLNLICSNTFAKLLIQSELYTPTNLTSFFWQIFGGCLPQTLYS